MTVIPWLRCAILIAVTAPTAPAAADAPDLVGTWTWSWKDAQGTAHKHVLEIERTGGKLAARERFDDLSPVKITDLKVDGKKLNFSVLRDDRRADYSGTIASDDTINGQVTVAIEGRTNEYGWTAKREPKRP